MSLPTCWIEGFTYNNSQSLSRELAKQAHNSFVTQGSSMAYESLKKIYTLELFVKSSY